MKIIQKMSIIYKLFTEDKNRFYYWFILIFLLLFVLSLYKTEHVEKIGNYFAFSNGDTKSYVEPMDFYMDHGDFMWSGGSLEKSSANYIGRGPYYAIPYYLFSQIFPRRFALDVVAILQLILFSISLTAMIKMMDKIIVNKVLHFIYLSVVLMISVGTRYIFAIIPESFSLSLSMLFIFYYVKYIEVSENKYLVFSSLLLALLCVLKPYFLPLYAVIGLHFLFTRKWVFRAALKYLIIMSLPLVLITLPFTVRNLKRFNTFAPVQNTTYGGFEMDPVTKAMRKTLKDWGESISTWDENALGSYFIPWVEHKGDFPQRLIVNGYTLNEIENLRVNCHKLNKQDLLACNESDSLTKSVINEFERIRLIYLKEKPEEKLFSYFRSFGILISAPVFITEQPANLITSVSYIFQLFKVVLYYLLLISGLIGIILLTINKQHFLVCLLTLFYIALFFFIFRSTERRFFIHAYFILLPGALYLIDLILNKYFIRSGINKINEFDLK